MHIQIASNTNAITGSFEVEFTGIGKFKITFALTDSNSSFIVTPEYLFHSQIGIVQECSSSVQGKVMEGKIYFYTMLGEYTSYYYVECILWLQGVIIKLFTNTYMYITYVYASYVY